MKCDILIHIWCKLWKVEIGGNHPLGMPPSRQYTCSNSISGLKKNLKCIEWFQVRNLFFLSPWSFAFTSLFNFWNLASRVDKPSSIILVFLMYKCIIIRTQNAQFSIFYCFSYFFFLFCLTKIRHGYWKPNYFPYSKNTQDSSSNQMSKNLKFTPYSSMESNFTLRFYQRKLY